MPHFGLEELGKFKPHKAGPVLRSLVARENRFGDEASGTELATVAFAGLSALLGIILFALAIVVLVRRAGNHGPYFWVLSAAGVFTLFNILDLPHWIMWYDDDLNYKLYTDMNAASVIFYWWTSAFLVAAALFLLRNRRNAAMATNSAPAGGLETVKLVIDMILLAVYIVLALARSAYVASINNADYSYYEYAQKIESYFKMGYILVVVLFLLILDVAISAIIARSRMSGPDLPSKTVLSVVVPMLILHWMWQTAMIVLGALEWYEHVSVSTRANRALNMVGTLETGLLFGGIMIALLVVGLKPAAWGKPVSHHTVYNAQPAIQNVYYQQPQYFQQQMYQPQQAVQYPQQQQWQAQPGVVYAQTPVHTQQQVTSNLPQV